MLSLVLQLHCNNYNTTAALPELLKRLNPKSYERRWTEDEGVRATLPRNVCTAVQLKMRNSVWVSCLVLAIFRPQITA